MSSRSWNRIELIGNVTRDPELRFTPNGAAVCTFGLATNRTYVVEGEKKEDVDFHRVVAWNKLGELCNQLLKKGTKTFISGRLQYREWETQEGQKRRDAEIVLEDMILLSPKGDNFTANEDVDNDPVEESVKAPTESNKKVEEEVEEIPDKTKVVKASSVNPEEVVNEDDLPF